MSENWTPPPEADLLTPENRLLVEAYIDELLESQYRAAQDDGDELIDIATVMDIDTLRRAFEESQGGFGR
jgi:hypothetical protein